MPMGSSDAFLWPLKRPSAKLPGPLSLLAQRMHESPLFLAPFPLAFETEGCMYTETQHPTDFDPEDGGSMYIRNVGKIVHTHTI
jgi:hypothetical protein